MADDPFLLLKTLEGGKLVLVRMGEGRLYKVVLQTAAGDIRVQGTVMRDCARDASDFLAGDVSKAKRPSQRELVGAGTTLAKRPPRVEEGEDVDVDDFDK